MNTKAPQRALVLALVCLGIAGCATSGAAAETSPTTFPTETVIGRAVKVSAPPAVMAAVKSAQRSGDVQGPVQWTRSTTQKAATLTQAQPGDRAVPIYVVQMQGRFRLDTAPRPPGAHSPEGTVLTVFVPIEGDPPQGASGLQLAYRATDLSPFGAVHSYVLGD